MLQNRKAFLDIAILPSMMHDNSAADFSSDLPGIKPVLIKGILRPDDTIKGKMILLDLSSLV